MSSTAEVVEGHLEQDLVLEEGLSRDVINLRRASRWLININGWDTTEEAVVSALRRYDPPPGGPSIVDARDALEAAELGTQTGLALVVTPRVEEAQRHLRKVWASLSGEPVLGLFPSQPSVRYLVEESVLQDLETASRRGYVTETIHPLFQASLRLPEGGAVKSLAYAIFLNTLGHRDVEVLESFSSGPDCTVLVREEDELEVHRALAELTGAEVEEKSPGGYDTEVV